MPVTAGLVPSEGCEDVNIFQILTLLLGIAGQQW